MAQNLEAIKGGGGSIRVGTTGTIGALMTRELESIKSEPKALNSPRTRHQTAPVSISCKAIAPKRSQPRKDGASSSGCADLTNNLDVHRKIKGGHMKNSSGIPMLESEENPTDSTPSRPKTDRKVTNIVEVVDIKCGNTEKVWAGPIANRLKKLGFSKLSEGTT